MKLRNKKTGKIAEAIDLVDACEIWGTAKTPSEIFEDWEFYEVPKGIWWIDNEGHVNHASGDVYDIFRENREIEIGNHFSTREEAEKAVEKLKAYKRLKDKGFAFKYLENNSIVFDAGVDIDDQHIDDMNLLFGGKE